MVAGGKGRGFICVVVLCVGVSAQWMQRAVYAEGMSSTNYLLNPTVSGFCGDRMESASYKAGSTGGQAMSGSSSSINYDARAGYWQQIPGCRLGGAVTLQSVAAGNQSEQITFELRRPGTTGMGIVMEASNDEDTSKPGTQVTTLADGSYVLKDIFDANYDITAKGTKWLRKKIEDTQISGGYNEGQNLALFGGDANNSNSVNILDLNILKATYGKSDGQAGYNDRADFNKTHNVNILDLNILKGNYGKLGAQ
jgi:hypothetical protein